MFLFWRKFYDSYRKRACEGRFRVLDRAALTSVNQGNLGQPPDFQRKSALLKPHAYKIGACGRLGERAEYCFWRVPRRKKKRWSPSGLGHCTCSHT